jgi:DNA-binding transcriptional LysR family regulator
VELKELPIDFRHLETFCRVAQLKSFSKAAQDLFLTQPTISGHILSIERFLSLRLFDRSGKEVRLTQAGKIFFKFALKILNSRKDLYNALSEFAQGIKGELSIGASTIPGEFILPKIIKKFTNGNHYPFLISVKIADTKEVIRYLLDGIIEFGMTGGKLNHNEVRYEKFGEDQIIVVASANHLIIKKKHRLHLEDLLKEPWIIREKGSGTQMAVERMLRKKGKSLKDFNVILEMGSTSAVKEGIKAGLGLAFISKRAVEEELTSGILYQIDLDDIDPISREIYIVTRRQSSLSPLGIKFLQFLKEN